MLRKSGKSRKKRVPGFEELRRPLPWHSGRYWYYKFCYLLLRTVGTLSQGIRTSYTNGFDSGAIMNYIYQNKPRGRFYVGRVLDKLFLEQVTCKAFRAIKEIQKNTIRDYLKARHNHPTFILDLASGKADYIYDVLGDTSNHVHVLLRDIDENVLKESRAVAEKLGLQDRVSFELGDALDVESLKNITPKPDLVIEVGLYGIIHDDESIKKHFFHLRDVLNPDALLFNVQTYNPQIELIARALVNQRGERCVWHLRPFEQVVKWAERAGFKQRKITMDPYGIYAVVMMGN